MSKSIQCSSFPAMQDFMQSAIVDRQRPSQCSRSGSYGSPSSLLLQLSRCQQVAPYEDLSAWHFRHRRPNDGEAEETERSGRIVNCSGSDDQAMIKRSYPVLQFGFRVLIIDIKAKCRIVLLRSLTALGCELRRGKVMGIVPGK